MVVHEVCPSGQYHAVRGFPYHATLSRCHPIKLVCYCPSRSYLSLDQFKTLNRPTACHGPAVSLGSLLESKHDWALPQDLLSQTLNVNKFATSVHTAVENLCAYSSWKHTGLENSLGISVVAKLSVLKGVVRERCQPSMGLLSGPVSVH